MNMLKQENDGIEWNSQGIRYTLITFAIYTCVVVNIQILPGDFPKRNVNRCL